MGLTSPLASISLGPESGSKGRGARKALSSRLWWCARCQAHQCEVSKSPEGVGSLWQWLKQWTEKAKSVWNRRTRNLIQSTPWTTHILSLSPFFPCHNMGPLILWQHYALTFFLGAGTSYSVSEWQIAIFSEARRKGKRIIVPNSAANPDALFNKYFLTASPDVLGFSSSLSTLGWSDLLVWYRDLGSFPKESEPLVALSLLSCGCCNWLVTVITGYWSTWHALGSSCAALCPIA